MWLLSEQEQYPELPPLPLAFQQEGAAGFLIAAARAAPGTAEQWPGSTEDSTSSELLKPALLKGDLRFNANGVTAL